MANYFVITKTGKGTEDKCVITNLNVGLVYQYLFMFE